jgi:hypothetical protein
MVVFENATGGVDVKVNDNHFGWIRERGFFAGPTLVNKFFEVSSDDLRKIATKVDEAKKQG